MLELVLRVAAFVVAALAIWTLAQPRVPSVRRVDGAALPYQLPGLVAVGAGEVYVTLVAAPSPVDRDLLAAIARAGTRVTWSGNALSPLVLSVERVREPDGGVRATLVSGEPSEVRDDLGVLDTLHAASGAVLAVESPVGPLRATALRSAGPLRAMALRSAGSGQRAEVAKGAALVSVPALLAPKPVLVLGRASWEAKFTIAALEEAGWTVEARLAVAPGADVASTLSLSGSIDPERLGAVVLLDSGLGVSAERLARFVRAGGGLVLSPHAVADPAVRALAVGRVEAREASVARVSQSDDPLRSLTLQPLGAMRPNAARLAVRGTHTAVAASRIGAGRVLQFGYDALWRWRMEGAAGSVAAHRAWWSHTVASVMPASAGTDVVWRNDNPAPLAQLVHALGPASAPAQTAAAWLPTALLPDHLTGSWLLPLLLMILIAEWTSRRLRGAR